VCVIINQDGKFYEKRKQKKKQNRVHPKSIYKNGSNTASRRNERRNFHQE
jgi:hypothetical protein